MNRKPVALLLALLCSGAGVSHAAQGFQMRVAAGIKVTAASSPSTPSTNTPTPTTSVAKLSSGNLNFGALTQHTGTVTRTLTFTNTGSGPMTLTGLANLPVPASLSGTCTNVAKDADCSLTVSLSTASVGVFDTAVLTQGATTNETIPLTASVTAPVAQSCLSIKNANASAASGVYNVDPDGSGPAASMPAYCDMTTDGGGWTLVARAISGQTAHTNANAVSSVTNPSQNAPAKFSDAVINQMATSHFRMRGDDGAVYYFKTQAGTPFAAVGVAASRPMSPTFNGTYQASPVNGMHGGLNAYPVVHQVYGDSAQNSGCRQGFATQPTSWCGVGSSGTLWVR